MNTSLTEKVTIALRGLSRADRLAIMEKAEANVDEKILKSGRRIDSDTMRDMIDEEILALMQNS